MTSPVRLEIIRASCNNCAKSKVRCSKDQPSCQRCLYQGVPCVYSPSQRSRKRPPPTPPATSPSVRTAISRDPNTNTQRGNDTLHPQPAPEVPSIDMAKANSMPESNDEPFPDESIFGPDTMSPMKWSELLEPFDSRPLSHDEMSCVLDPSPMQTPNQPQIDSNLDTGFPWLLPPDTDKQPFWSVPPHQTPHQCSQLAMSAIQRLDVPVASCPSLGRLDYDTQSTTHVNNGTARSFDDILKDSHSSLEDLLTILGCPCTAKIDLIFLVTTSCTRVLSWYQASLDRSAACPNRDIDSSESSNGSDRSRGSIGGSRRSHADSSVVNGLSRSFHEWVSIPSINVGAYTLEPGQTRRMVAQLILAEIDKVKEVLRAFNHSYCRQKGGFGEDDEKGLHMALEAYLRHQMKAVAMTARENLN
ncbi:uncharacterized protein N7506_002973 [Penicillium brevicompactum]|uniref:uncharacterized protein n=1 Tax=Penicillium brevicompactum TaxID=5074 RepID=UPI00254152EE|nr:uncharacterized protein N7506_002973 [Penicillium brevicompactum]KAJ5343149.1 hypothetical protein N7506_002973 [Penicillium brevicompactum]